MAGIETMSTKADFLVQVGSDIRKWREGMKFSLEQVAEVCGWERNNLSMKERGLRDITVHDYLDIVFLLEPAIETDHPALALLRRIRDATKRGWSQHLGAALADVALYDYLRVLDYTPEVPSDHPGVVLLQDITQRGLQRSGTVRRKTSR